MPEYLPMRYSNLPLKTHQSMGRRTLVTGAQAHLVGLNTRVAI